VNSEKERIAFAERAKVDPVWFVKYALGGDPWGKQCEFLESIRDNKRTSMRSCHGTGKTRTEAWAAVWFSLTHPDSIVVTTAPTWFQVEELLWREVRGIYNNSKCEIGGKLTGTKLEFGDNWVAYGLSTNDPNRFQGSHAVSGDILLLADEAPGVEQEIFDSAEGFLVSEGSRFALCGNPTMLTGEFYQSFRGKLYNKISVSAFETPNFTTFGITIEDIRNNTWQKKINKPLPRPYLITPAWVAEKHIKWGENNPLWTARVLGEFSKASDGTLIPLAWIERAQARWHDKDVKNHAGVILGADIGLGNPDPATIVKRTGVRPLVRIQRVRDIYSDDTMEIAGIITQDCKTMNAKSVNIDRIGLGHGTACRVKENKDLGLIEAQVRAINSAQPAMNEAQYFNQRAEMGWNLRKLFENDNIAIDPQDEEAAEELAAVRTYGKSGLDGKGRIRLEPKAETKERLGRSPNFFDASCLACAQAGSEVKTNNLTPVATSRTVKELTFNSDGGVINNRIAKFMKKRMEEREAELTGK